MSYDFIVHHPISNQRDAKNLPTTLEPYARIMLFAQVLLSSDKDKVRGKEYKSELNKLGTSAGSSLLADLNLETPQAIDLSILPLGSFFISFKFQLVRPYLSSDDESLYIVDNPVAKDKVFKQPMVRSSTWKGSLRNAIRLAQGWWDNNTHPDLLRLFGTASDDNLGKRGRLYFYPTFFNRADREIINPHDREKKAGRQPIYFESVPDGTTGTFALLYVPLDCIGKSEAKTRQQAVQDLELIAQGLEAMFTLYGFGAKTSSGFGVAADQVQSGQISLNLPGFTFPQDEALKVQKPEEAFLKYLDDNGVVRSGFQGSEGDGLLSNNEYKEVGEQAGGGSLSEYRKFKNWYGKHGEAWQEQLQSEGTDADVPSTSFSSFTELVEIVSSIEPDSTKSEEQKQ